MEMIMMQFTVDADIYEQAKAILDSLGISVEESIMLFFKAVVARNDLPFPLSEQDQEYMRNSSMDESDEYLNQKGEESK